MLRNYFAFLYLMIYNNCILHPSKSISPCISVCMCVCVHRIPCQVIRCDISDSPSYPPLSLPLPPPSCIFMRSFMFGGFVCCSLHTARELGFHLRGSKVYLSVPQTCSTQRKISTTKMSSSRLGALYCICSSLIFCALNLIFCTLKVDHHNRTHHCLPRGSCSGHRSLSVNYK